MFCDEEPQALPWDYFLTSYERDLLKLNIDDLIIKCQAISKDQIESDLIFIQKSGISSR